MDGKSGERHPKAKNANTRPCGQRPRPSTKTAIRQGDLRPTVDLEAVIDMLYGPIYYRLQIEIEPLDNNFTDTIFEQSMRGLRRSA
jgi:hypothetical protein